MEPAATGMLVLVCLTLGWARAGERVPSPLPGPDPKLALAGTVWGIAMQPDGGAIIAGDFKSIEGVPRLNLARRLPSGGLDPDWKVDADGVVFAVAVDELGAIYIGGRFHHVAGVARESIAKISATGVLDPAWTASVSGGDISALVLDQQGSLLVSGNFNQVNGAPANFLAKISTVGNGAREEWSTGTDRPVAAMAVGPDGAVYVAGHFTSIGGVARSGLARLADGSGLVDPDWNVALNSLPYLYALAVDSQNRVYVGGSFTSIGGVPRGSIARVIGNGEVDPGWAPYLDCTVCVVQTLVVSAAGDVFAGGGFSRSGARETLVKIDADWNQRALGIADGSVTALALGSEGVILAGGSFTTVQYSQRLGFAAIDASGAVLAATDAELPGRVLAIATQSNGGVIIGGNFLKGGGMARRNLLRLDAAGHVDPGWDPSMEREVTKLAVDGNEFVYAASRYRRFQDSFSNGIARISGAGPAETVWTGLIGAPVSDMFVDGTGNLYFAGSFNLVGELQKPFLARMSRKGEVDPDWNPPRPTGVSAIAPAGGDSVLVAYAYSMFPIGRYRGEIARVSTIDGSTSGEVVHVERGVGGLVEHAGQHYVFGAGDIGGVAGGVARLLANGQVDPSFVPSFQAQVAGLVVGGDGYVYLGGYIWASGEEDAVSFRRVSEINAALDHGWGHTADWHVTEMKAAPAGRLYVGGEFSAIDGVSRAGFAVLDGDGAIFANSFD